MIKLVINGILGRMGQELVKSIQHDDRFQLLGGIDLESINIGRDYLVTTDPDEIIPQSDVVIDFSLPAGAVQTLDVCLENNKPLLTGTTGLSDSQKSKFVKAAKSIPIVQTYNFSIGVNLLLKLAKIVSAALKDKADAEIVELHHRMKKDAPSGTALLLARQIAEALNADPDDLIMQGRAGADLKRENEIGIHSVRGGSVVGEHQILFLGENENLILTHQALNRKIFVDGALQAAEWITGQPAGLYTMQHVLKL